MHSPADGRASGFLPDVQGLRALAVLLVVLYHASVPGWSGGYVGVDVFFVISGYLIGGMLVREREATGRIAFAAFYARRARRLLPAAFAAILGALVVSRIALAPMEQQQVASSGIAATMYVSNVLFAWRSTDYLAGGLDDDPLLHTWSLAVEEQFYLVWPALVAIATIGATTGRLKARLTGVFAAVSIVSFVISVWVTRSNQPWAFFGMHARAWEFGLGALTYLYCDSRAIPLSRTVRNIIGAAGILMIGGAAVTLNRFSSFPGIVALVPVGGAALAIIAGRGSQPVLVTRCLSIVPLRWLGDISYSLYLWHWPALVASRATGMGPRGTAAMLALALAAAQASYSWLENPIRHSRRLVARPVASLAGALVLTLAIASVERAAQAASDVDMLAGGQWAYFAAHEDLPVVYDRGCNAEYDEVQLGDCAFGDLRSPRKIVLYGDSHAAHWFPALEIVAATLDAELISLTKSACPSVEVPIFATENGGRSIDCDVWRANMVRRIVAERPMLVVIANYWHNIAADSKGRPTTTSPAEWRAGLDVLVADLQPARLPILIIQDNPRAPWNVPVCLSRALWRDGTTEDHCRFNLTDRAQPLLDEEKALASSRADVSVLDMTDRICGTNPCDVTYGGMPRYRDNHHLTATFSRSLAPFILKHIEREAHRNPKSRLSGLVGN